jgi:hypothetical protein
MRHLKNLPVAGRTLFGVSGFEACAHHAGALGITRPTFYTNRL